MEAALVPWLRGCATLALVMALVGCGSSGPRTPLANEPVIHVPTGSPPARLVVRSLITGTGEAAKPGDDVTVNYVGVLYRNGRVFDASWQRHRTSTVRLSNGAVISGWIRGILGERVGGRRELIIPPNLAYGASGSPPKIPPNATLVYDIDLLAVSANAGDA
jgi:peptidylprolyl isomerase